MDKSTLCDTRNRFAVRTVCLQYQLSCDTRILCVSNCTVCHCRCRASPRRGRKISRYRKSVSRTGTLKRCEIAWFDNFAYCRATAIIALDILFCNTYFQCAHNTHAAVVFVERASQEMKLSHWERREILLSVIARAGHRQTDQKRGRAKFQNARPAMC